MVVFLKLLIQLQMKFFILVLVLLRKTLKVWLLHRTGHRYQLQGVDGLINLSLDGNETLYLGELKKMEELI